jgi:hypothetical protein
MHHIDLVVMALTHQIYRSTLTLTGAPRQHDHDIEDGIDERDRGAVTLEQVLWFVAAAVSVAGIAAILWAKIEQEANVGVTRPSAP